MRRPGTLSDHTPTAGRAEPRAIDGVRVASELEALGRDLISGEVPDDELLRRVEAFADLFLAADGSAFG